MSSLQYQEFIAERARPLERIKELEEENAELRKRLGEPVTPTYATSKVIQNLSLQEKVELFCSLFKGREDVFARRWYSKTSGKAVIYSDSLSLHAAIIDKSTIWYGSVKILGFHSTEDNLIRFINAEIASNLFDSLQK